MSRTSLRAILAVLLMMTIATKTQVSANLSRDKFTGNVLDVISAHRLSTYPVPTRDLLPAAARIAAPGCDGTIDVIPVHINLQEAPLFDTFVKPNSTRLFAFLDKTWSSEDRIGMRLTWLRHRLLSFVGLGHFSNSTTGLLIASPAGCAAALAIDWAPVWRSQPLTEDAELIGALR